MIHTTNIKFERFEDNWNPLIIKLVRMINRNIKAQPHSPDTRMLVAGGAFRSILVGDTVNDYDFFFQDRRDIAATLALFEASHKFKKVFACPKGHLYTFTTPDGEADGKLIKIQLITRHIYYDAQELLNSFDFTLCQAVGDFGYSEESTPMFWFGDTWARDVKKKRAVIASVSYPVATINRIGKYKQYGYFMTERSWHDLIAQIQVGTFDGEHLALYID